MLTTHIKKLIIWVFHRRAPRMFDDRRAQIMLAGATFIQILFWVYAAWQVRPQEGLLFLHYNIYFGVDLIGPWYQFYLLPVIGLVILIVNALFARLVYRRQRQIAYIVLSITIVYQFLLLLASYLIIQQNSRGI